MKIIANKILGFIKTAITSTTVCGMSKASKTITKVAASIPTILARGRSFAGFTNVKIPNTINRIEVKRLRPSSRFAYAILGGISNINPETPEIMHSKPTRNPI